MAKAKAASKPRQFARWLNNTKIDHATIYPKLVKTVLADWGSHQIYLTLGSSACGMNS